MEQSIENIWKEGFLNNDALIAPKLNDLYNQKSKSITEKLQRMMKINRVAILIFAFVNLGLYAAIGVPYAGLFICVMLLAVLARDIFQGKRIESIDKGLNSYEFLKAFNDSLKKNFNDNIKFARIFYPSIFLAALVPIIHSLKSDNFINQFFQDSGFHLIYGIPTFGWAIVATIVIIMYALAGKLYRWDINLVYGRIFKRLEEIIKHMEELRS